MARPPDPVLFNKIGGAAGVVMLALKEELSRSFLQIRVLTAECCLYDDGTKLLVIPVVSQLGQQAQCGSGRYHIVQLICCVQFARC